MSRNCVKQKIKNPLTSGFVSASGESYAYGLGEPERPFSKMVGDEGKSLSLERDTMYLIRANHLSTGPTICTAEEDGLRVTPVERRRTKRLIGAAGGFQFREVEFAGWDRTRLALSATPIRTAVGREHTRPEHAYCDKTAAGLKKVLRRVRPQEADLLAAADAEIAAAEDALRLARLRRIELVSLAWQKARVVRLNELDVQEPART